MVTPITSQNQAPKKRLFGGVKKIPPPLQTQAPEEVAILARRLKLLEERYARIENNLRNIEENMNSISRDFGKSASKMKSEITASHEQVAQMQERMLMFIKELELLAKNEDLQVVKKYLKYWDPVKFVQVTHVEKIVKDVLHEMGLFERV